MRAEEYDYLETIYEEYQENERRNSMTQEERDKEDFVDGAISIVGIVIIGLIIFLIQHL